ncbi:MAG: hypothetical protein J6N70_12545, partial [Oribacterium sp.]|nr:hypothetical protein [Oribacterium sp.]
MKTIGFYIVSPVGKVIINGKWVCNEVILIDGKYYGFDPLGFLYKDRSFYLIDDQGNYTDEYRAKADGSLYENEWYDEEDGKVYYGEKGVKAENTVLLIDDHYYGFDYSGVLYVDKEFTINENSSYRAKEDGSLYQNEWYQYDDEAYDGTIVTYKSYYDSDCLQVKDT